MKLMKSRSGRAAVVLAIVFLLGTPALAGKKTKPEKGGSDARHSWNGVGRGHHHHRGCGHGQGGQIPELDPGLLGSAAVLLIGGTLALHGRRRIGADV